MKEITTGHSIGRGRVNDNIFLNFIASAFNYRYIIGNRKAAFHAHYAVGYLSYSNYAKLINERMIISAQNVGMSVGANFVVPLGQRWSFTPGVTLTGSSFGTFKIHRASGMPISIHVNADDGRENVSRLDFSARLRWRI